MRYCNEAYIIRGHKEITLRPQGVRDFGAELIITERDKDTVYIEHYDDGYSIHYIATKDELKTIEKLLKKGWKWAEIVDYLLEKE